MADYLIYELEVEQCIRECFKCLEIIDPKLKKDYPKGYIVAKIATFLEIWDVAYVKGVLKEAGLLESSVSIRTTMME